MLSYLTNPKILVIGGGGRRYGYGIASLGKHLIDRAINLELEKGPLVSVISDAHHLPTKDSVFDCVIVQAVLEHIVEPDIVVSEIYRVLKPGSIVYAEIPFMQGYHAAPDDYRRFTISGLRRLFSHFMEIKLGICCGPSSTVTWVMQEYLATVFSFNIKILYKILSKILGWMLFPLNYIDLVITRYETSINIASALFFLGKKRDDK